MISCALPLVLLSPQAVSDLSKFQSLCEEVVDLEHLRESRGRQVRVRPSFHAELERLGKELAGTSKEMNEILTDVEKVSKVRVGRLWIVLIDDQAHTASGFTSRLSTVQYQPAFGMLSYCRCFRYWSGSDVSHTVSNVAPYGSLETCNNQAPAGKIKLEFNAVHSHHLRVTKKDQALVGKCKAALTLSVQKVTRDSCIPRCDSHIARVKKHGLLLGWMILVCG